MYSDIPEIRTSCHFHPYSMIIFLVLCVFNGLCGAAPFTLVDTRSVGSNSITLRCRRTSDETFEPMAQYFRNGLGVHAIEGFLNTNNEPGIVTFQINRRLEGNYSCGTQLQRSYSIPFIGEPLVNYTFMVIILLYVHYAFA